MGLPYACGSLSRFVHKLFAERRHVNRGVGMKVACDNSSVAPTLERIIEFYTLGHALV